jgi:hypothetical protein
VVYSPLPAGQVSAFVGDAELEGALKGADLVVIPAGMAADSSSCENIPRDIQQIALVWAGSVSTACTRKASTSAKPLPAWQGCSVSHMSRVNSRCYNSVGF